MIFFYSNLFKRIPCDYRSAVSWLYFWIFGKRAWDAPHNQNVKSPSNEKCTICASVLAFPWQPLWARHPPRTKIANGFSTRGTNYDDYEKIDLHCVPETITRETTTEAIFNYSASPATAAGNGGNQADLGLSWMLVFSGTMSLNSVFEHLEQKGLEESLVISLVHLNASLKSFIYAFSKHL